MKKVFRRAVALLALAAAPLTAQGVLVAPQGVFIDHRTRSGSIELYNPGTEPAEVTISTLFGYPVSDSLGNTTLYTTATPDSGAPSAAAWVTAFPRRLTVAPRQRQTVRLLARPPQDLPDGEYWTRLVVQAKGGSVPLASADSAIQVGLSLEVRTIIALLYRKGSVRSGVALDSLRAQAAGDSLEVRATLTRTGNAAYIGTVRGTLVDATGREVATFTMPLAVYHTLTPRFTVPIAGLAPGRYTLRVQLDTDRGDVARGALLPSAPVTRTADVTLAPPAP